MLGCALDSSVTRQDIRLNHVFCHSADSICVTALQKKPASSLFSVCFAAHHSFWARRLSEPCQDWKKIA